ncbi:polysaccharide deacetylase family protein [Pandoraea capi]|uniref:polysaccharide deacetylase family protein n=1 Tax=Pandoraea TaxID=93217 RepID=UPI001F5CB128|nr:polysaccharide deacetylase family protein [Pandoraea capi]MCI3205441.1 polysaccharide deacetylase family protein [Pandoraea sp. LA3]MDN4583469.1 polysaccharide deacetylase family protein [Pandoraea capi]
MNPITLTFDNGPTKDVTPYVLDVLARYDIRSTFFVLGRNLMDAPNRALMLRAADEGHWIGNHTYMHDVPLGLSTDPDAPEREIGRTQALIGDAAHPDRFFRPFGGGGELGPLLFNPLAVDYLRRHRYSCVLWNSIPRDWNDPDGWVATALRQCAQEDWALTVLHDIASGAMRRLETFIQKALDAGHTFRQEFPRACVPMLRGTPVRSMRALISQS